MTKGQPSCAPVDQLHSFPQVAYDLGALALAPAVQEEGIKAGIQSGLIVIAVVVADMQNLKGPGIQMSADGSIEERRFLHLPEIG